MTVTPPAVAGEEAAGHGATQGASTAVRVVHLCSFSPPYPASFVPALESIRERVQLKGWEFEAVFAPGADKHAWYREARDGGMRVRTSRRLPRRARAGWVTDLLAEHAGPTVLHTHFASWDLPAVQAARLRRHPYPVAVIWHRHGILSRKPWLLARDLVRYGGAGRAVDAHLCVGPGGHDQLLRRGTPPKRTLLVPNPVDVHRFTPIEPSERVRARAELGLDRDAAVLVAFVWEWERKGGPLLLRVIADLAGDRDSRLTALLVGGGPVALQQAKRLGIERAVCAVPLRPDVRTWFAAADVFVAPSKAEAFGYAPHEAVSCGTPVVASDVSGHRYFGAHLPAMTLAPLAVRPFADAVEAELAADRGDRAARIAASRRYLERHASVDAWVGKLVHVYEEALARRGAAGVGWTTT